MKTELSQSQVDAYREDGFLKIDAFLDQGELEYWRAAVSHAAKTRDERIPGFNDGGRLGDAYYDNVFKQRVNLWRTDAAVRNIALDPRIGRMAARLEGQPSVRLWHDQALFKGPWANPTSWHIDDPYWSFYTRHATSLWVALDDAMMQNGALYFLPGVHADATFENVFIGENVGALFDVYSDWKTIEPVCIEMKAGDASFHNGLTPHAAGPNMTPGMRRAYAIIYMPNGSVFNGIRNILPEDKFALLKEGDLLNDDDFNPVIFDENKMVIA